MKIIELVFTVIVLSIVLTIGMTTIAPLYDAYIFQKLTKNSSLKLNIATEQIYKYLQNSITQTITINSSSSLNSIEWIGYDNDSFLTYKTPGWSGYCDTNNSTAQNGISSPGSKLSITTDIVKNLSASTNTPLATIFHLNNNQISSIHNVTPINNTTLYTNQPSQSSYISNDYKLSWSSFKILPQDNNLILYYNYQPWVGETYLNAKSSLLITNISTFLVTKNNNILTIKLCIDNDFLNSSQCEERSIPL